MKKNTLELQTKNVVVDGNLEIPPGCLYALFRNETKRANLLSPLYSMKPSGKIIDDAVIEKLSSSPGFDLIREIILRPDLRIEHRYGGANIGLTVFSAFKCDDSSLTVVCFPQNDGALILRVYPQFGHYLDWWTTLLTSRVSNAVANFLPPPLSVAQLIYGLHAIDCYRRYSYKKSLEYEAESSPSISCLEYNGTLAKSIASYDLRWLLSSLFALTPDLDGIKFEPGEEDLANLVRRTIINPARDENGESLFYFGEAGQYLGAEFLRAWELSIGVSARRIVNGKIESIYRAFIAPTALSNHLFQFEFSPDGVSVNHQSQTFGNLLLALESGFSRHQMPDEGLRSSAAEKSSVVDADGEKSVAGDAGANKVAALKTAADQSRLERVCTVCGWQSIVTAKFCSGCGGKLDDSADDKQNRQISRIAFESLAMKLRQAQENRSIAEKEFKSLHLRLKCKTVDGNTWTVGLKKQDWYKEVSGKWQKTEPPENVLIEDELFSALDKLR